MIRTANGVERTVAAGAIVWFYLAKSLLPIDLVFIYPQWQIALATMSWWIPLAAGLLVTAILLRQRQTRLGKCLLFAWGLYCVALLPVLGFTDVTFMRHSLVANHYAQLALIVVAATVGAAVSACYARFRARCDR